MTSRFDRLSGLCITILQIKEADNAGGLLLSTNFIGVSFGSLADIRPASRRLSRSQACEGLFPLFGRLCHALKKDRRSFYRHSFTGTVNLPPPGFSWPSSSLHGERIVGWIKFSPHHALERKRGSTWMICLHGEQPLIPVSIIVFIPGAV